MENDLIDEFCLNVTKLNLNGKKKISRRNPETTFMKSCMLPQDTAKRRSDIINGTISRER